MKKKRTLSIVVLILVALLVYVSHAVADEKEVLKALEKIKGSVEAGESYDRYCELVADAKMEINIYKQGKRINDKFLSSVEFSYSQYETARGFWKKKMVCEETGETEGGKFYQEGIQVCWKAGAQSLDQAYEVLKYTQGHKKK